jgi:probable F420-dependent oxidoreductase
MRLGVHLGWQVSSGTADPPFSDQALAMIEGLGFESVWVGDHAVIPLSRTTSYPGSPGGEFPHPRDVDIPSPLVWIAYAAARTKTLKLGTQVLILPHYNPLLLAKEAGTIDRLSGGRLLLGVGLGWWPEEAEAVGYAFKDRLARMEECVAVLRAIWGGAQSYEGRWSRFSNVRHSPLPVQPGAIPILIGGTSAAAAKRAGRIGDGWFPYPRHPDDLLSLLPELRSAAVAAGREPDSIELTCPLFMTQGDSQTEIRRRVGLFERLGAQRLVINCSRVAEIGELERFLTGIQRAVALS